ncbi:MAG: ATP-dependent helicase, partial [Verrucomicrobia bacterium]|nr:ATP-dependent helicase [Verrucomicrobiota bacterium]
IGDIVRVYEAYRARKHELGAMDFDDLLVKCLNLLRDHGDLVARYQEQFQHVLVDEYQDTNTIQAEIVDLLGGGSRNILVGGDDFQSIYSWRGADYRNIMSFPERYPDAKTVMLETNYRSVPEILAVANACIAGNPDQFQKVLRPTREPYERPCIARVRDGDEQARFIVERMRRLRAEGYRYSDMAILYRAHYHALELERLLPRVHIPYVITSGVRFFEQAHIKDVCSLLRLMISRTDELAVTRLLGLLAGVGERTAAKVWQRLGGHFDYRDPSQRATVSATLPAKARPAWQTLDDLLAEFSDREPESAGADLIVRFTDVFYEHYLINTFENFDHRLDDVQALATDVAKFESLESFLSDVALLTNVDGEEDQATTDAESIRLSTVHQAKGLEWPVVFIIWATEGMFPSARSLQENDAGESEERRLFYVAVTRAKDELCICVPEVRRMRDGGMMYCPPSRFVDEISGALVRDERPGFI